MIGKSDWDDYEVPKCDCGDKLIISQIERRRIFAPIKSDGSIGAFQSKLTKIDVKEDELLKCEKCHKFYRFKKDNHLRIVRNGGAI